MAEPPVARRRRRRASAAPDRLTPPVVNSEIAPSPGSNPDGARVDAEAAPKAPGRSAAKRGPRPRRGEHGSGGGDRALSGLVGAGPSQVGVDRALRARDVNRPTDDDLAEAEQGIEIVRRHWKPDTRG